MILATTNELLPRHVQHIFEQTGEQVHVYPTIEETPQEIAEQTEILLTFPNNITHANPEPINIGKLPRLKWLQLLSAGIDELPLDQIKERGICLTNASGIHVVPMSEYVLMCMLYFEKDMDRYFAHKQQKIFDRTKLVGELLNREVLIYGTGVIGTGVARTLRFFQAKVYGVNTSGRAVEPFLQTYKLDEAMERLRTADYVVSILPATPETTGLFSREYLENLKPEAVFINIGRGSLVDEEYVATMLRSGRLRGAALDVFQTEPLPADSPLWDCPNLILTPHMSAKSIYYMDRCVEIFVENLLAYRQQKAMRNVVMNQLFS